MTTVMMSGKGVHFEQGLQRWRRPPPFCRCDYQLRYPLVRNVPLLTEAIKQLLPLHAQRGLEAASGVVDARMDDCG